MKGSVSIAESDGPLPELTVTYRAESPEVGAEEAVSLTRQSPTRSSFRLDLSSRPRGSRATVDTYLIRLRLITGEILAERSIELRGGEDTDEVDWQVVPEPTWNVMAEESPIVHAYVVRGVPACPDPDPELVWE